MNLCRFGIHDRQNLHTMYNCNAVRVPAWQKRGYLCPHCCRWKRNWCLWQWKKADWLFILFLLKR